jgi:type IV pilus assembly protein PilA
MSTAWFYADRHHQQQGPVEAAALVALVHRGEVTSTSLVWRAGMPGWVPLSQVAAELGLVPRTASAAPRAAPRPVANQRTSTYSPRTGTVQETNTRRVVASKSGGVSAWVIVLIIALAAVPVLGIVAAIAIPAYADYTMRARISNGLNTATALKPLVSEFKLTENRCPKNGEGGIASPETYGMELIRVINVDALEDGRCVIEIEHYGIPGDNADPITQLILENDNLTWVTNSTVPQRMLPARFRNGGG